MSNWLYDLLIVFVVVVGVVIVVVVVVNRDTVYAKCKQPVNLIGKTKAFAYETHLPDDANWE